MHLLGLSKADNRLGDPANRAEEGKHRLFWRSRHVAATSARGLESPRRGECPSLLSRRHIGPASVMTPDGADRPSKRSRESETSDKHPSERSNIAPVACAECRKNKTRCVGGSNPPCQRCANSGLECILSTSARGKMTGRIREVSEQYTEVTKKYESLEGRLNSIEALLRQVLADRAAPPPTHRVTPSQDALLNQPALFDETLPNGADHQTNGQRSASVSQGVLPLRGTRTHTQLDPASDLSPLSTGQPTSPTPRLAALPAPRPGEDEQAAAPERILQQISPASAFSHFRDLVAAKRKTTLNIRQDWEPIPDLNNLNSVLTRQGVEQLFDVYFSYLHRHCAILDPAYHSVERTMRLSTLLTMTICSIAVAHYPPLQNYRAYLCSMVNKLVAQTVETGIKSIEAVQSFLLLSLWSHASLQKDTASDRTWTFLGLAIRMATDLNLAARSPAFGLPPGCNSVERAYRYACQRVWLWIYVEDRSLSHQLGRTVTLTENAVVECDVERLPARDQPVRLLLDLHRMIERTLMTLVERESAAQTIGYPDPHLLFLIERQANLWFTQSRERILKLGHEVDLGEVPHPGEVFRFYKRYWLMTLFSYSLHMTLQRNVEVEVWRNYFKSVGYAKETLEDFDDGWNDWLRYAPDQILVYIVQACCMLVKLSRPAFAHFASDEERSRPLSLITRMIERLEAVSLDNLSTPYLYADFLRQLLNHAKAWAHLPPLPAARFSTGQTPGHLNPFHVLAPSPFAPDASGGAAVPDFEIPMSSADSPMSAIWLNNMWDQLLGANFGRIGEPGEQDANVNGAAVINAFGEWGM